VSQLQITQTPTPLLGLARNYLQLTSNAASAVLGIGLSILLGISPLPSSFPLIGLAHAYPTASLIVGALLLLLVVVSVLVVQRARLDRMFGPGMRPRVARFCAAAILSASGSALLSILFGVSSLPPSSPLVEPLRSPSLAGLGLIGLLLALIIFSPLFAFSGGPPGPEGFGRGGPRAALYSSLAISTISTLLFVSLLGTVLIRPSWCPTAICPAPAPVTNPHGVHDANLEVFYTAVQSSAYLIPGDPAQYSVQQGNLPQQTGALRIDEPFGPYRAVIGVHNLRRGANDAILIERVIVLIDRVDAPPVPLQVWNAKSDIDYHSNPVEATYRGEPAGTMLNAFSITTPPTQVHLTEGESDEIDVQLVSTQVARVQFRVQVAYRLTSESEVHSLTLQQSFDLIFAHAANWHIYQLQDGRFVPAT